MLIDILSYKTSVKNMETLKFAKVLILYNKRPTFIFIIIISNNVPLAIITTAPSVYHSSQFKRYSLFHFFYFFKYCTLVLIRYFSGFQSMPSRCRIPCS